MVAAYIYLYKDERKNLGSLRRELSDWASGRGDSIDCWVVSSADDDSDGIRESLLNGMEKGDTVYVEEMSRLGSTFEGILKSIYEMVSYGLNIHGMRDGFSTDDIGDIDTYLSTLVQMGNVFGKMVSNRTKAALAKCRMDGVTLGRPAGSDVKMSVLLENKDAIERELKLGVSYADLSRKYKVSYSTFRRFKTSYLTGRTSQATGNNN